METSEKIPTVLVLDPVAPSSDTVASETLRYAKLDASAEKHATYDTRRMNRFFDAESDSMKEESAARQWALQNLLMTAQKLNATKSEASMELWSQRYTQSSREVFGEPDAQTALVLAQSSTASLLERSEKKGDSECRQHFEELAQKYGLLGAEATHEVENDYTQVAEKVGEYYRNKYKDVFDAFSFDETTTSVNPEDYATKAELALSIMAQNHDSSWSSVKVIRDKESNILKPHPSNDEFIVGMQRSPMTPDQATGLFSHEVLVHLMRRMNGRKLSSRLEKGLTGYLDAEEGLGVIAEFAITGTLPEKNVERYVDIALALGMIDGEQKTRKELIDFAGTRALLKNSLKSEQNRVSEEEVMNEVYTHVNRIYRGSLGDNHIGIFTKDITYQKGFTQMIEYIKDNMDAGKSVEAVMEYLLQGKFDPLNPRHVGIVDELAA